MPRGARVFAFVVWREAADSALAEQNAAAASGIGDQRLPAVLVRETGRRVDEAALDVAVGPETEHHGAAASGSCTVNGAMGTGYTFGCGNGASPCNLASVYSAFGTFCGGSAIACGAGCSAVNMSTTYNLEAGCTATITAEYKARPTISAACSNAAMDGGDQLFITSIGGSLVGQSANLTGCGAFSSNVSSTIGSGCGNGDGIVTMTITGGAVTIGGVMDRGDEIITYTLNASGTCSICPTLLPIGLIDFYGVRNDDKNDIYWKVDFQEDIQYYMIEKSGDGVNFDQFGIIPAHTYKSNDAKNYYMEDYSPYSYITYYRLSVRESNGAVKIYNTVYVNTKSMDHWGIYHYQKEENLVIDFKINLNIKKIEKTNL